MTIAIPRVSAFRHLDHLIFLPHPPFPSTPSLLWLPHRWHPAPCVEVVWYVVFGVQHTVFSEGTIFWLADSLQNLRAWKGSTTVTCKHPKYLARWRGGVAAERCIKQGKRSFLHVKAFFYKQSSEKLLICTRVHAAQKRRHSSLIFLFLQ